MSIESKEHLLSQRNELRFILTRLPLILDGDPRTWYKAIAKDIVYLHRRRDVLPPEMREYLAPIFNRAKHILHKEAEAGKTLSSNDINDELIGTRAHINMIGLSQQVSEQFSTELEPIKERVVSIDELIVKNPKRLSRHIEEEDGITFTMIGVRHPTNGEEYFFKLPLDNFSYHKGGIARLMLEIYAGARSSMQLCEIPWNDVDVYTIGGDEEECRDRAKLIGADVQGIEIANGDKFDFSQYANGRDMTFNQVCLGVDGLHYSDAAFQAAQTGHIELVGHYIPDRAIYGFDRYPVKLNNEPLILAKPRGMMRYIKSLAEGKALSFDYLPVNQNLDFGIYWLVLARKWAKTQDSFADRMQKMFYICRQMGQTRDNENGIMDSLSRIHVNYPFFNLEHEFKGEAGVARWIGGKLIKQLDREFGWLNELPSGVKFIRREGDTTPKTVSIEGFQYDPEEGQWIVSGWEQFTNDCRNRLKIYEDLKITPAERYFVEVDTQGLPDYIQELM